MYESELTDDAWEDQLNSIHNDIEEEEKLWQRQGISPQMLQINIHILQMKVNALMAILKRFGVSEMEMEATFKTAVLEQLKMDRAVLTEAKLKAQRPDITVPYNAMLGPNGRLL